MAQLELIETNLDQGYRKISVVGELDLAVAAQLEEAIGRAAGAACLLIDLSSCDFIDSVALPSSCGPTGNGTARDGDLPW